MAIENITMPQLGESVTEGTISKWLVSPGDRVNKYDPLAEVMTDKVNAEIPSSFEGVIKELVAGEGETLAVGEVICVMETKETAEEAAVDDVQKAAALESVSEKQNLRQPAGKARYSPAVLKLASEHQVDLTYVQGTGMNGRITRKDILKLIESGIPAASHEAPKEAVQETALVPKPKEAAQPITRGDIEIPVTGVRKAIAANMLRSKNEIPHAWMMIEADVTNLVAYRNRVKEEFKQREGFNLTFFAFFIKAVAQALKEFPQMNSMWAGDTIIQKKDIHISIAVATDTELFVPVVKHADEKTIKGIARDIAELAHKARTKTLQMADMQGGTFTVNNTGSFGSIQSMGIINYPQAAILQVESIVKRPVFIDGMFGARDMVNLCLSLDHRVLDGLICGRFLARVKEILEHISKETTSLY